MHPVKHILSKQIMVFPFPGEQIIFYGWVSTDVIWDEVTSEWCWGTANMAYFDGLLGIGSLKEQFGIFHSRCASFGIDMCYSML